MSNNIGNTKEGSFKQKDYKTYTSYTLKSKRPFYGFKIYTAAIYVKKVYIRKHLKLCLLGFVAIMCNIVYNINFSQKC